MSPELLHTKPIRRAKQTDDGFGHLPRKTLGQLDDIIAAFRSRALTTRRAISATRCCFASQDGRYVAGQ